MLLKGVPPPPLGASGLWICPSELRKDYICVARLLSECVYFNSNVTTASAHKYKFIRVKSYDSSLPLLSYTNTQYLPRSAATTNPPIVHVQTLCQLQLFVFVHGGRQEFCRFFCASEKGQSESLLEYGFVTGTISGKCYG